MTNPRPVGKLGVFFQNLMQSNVNASKRIALRYEGNDERVYEVEIDPSCAGITIHALMRHLAEIEPEKVQPLKVTSASGAQFEDGSPMLILRLEDGGELPLILQSGDVNELIDLLRNTVPPSKAQQH